MPHDVETPLLSLRYVAAFQLAHEVHATQKRKGTTIPYLAHVMAVSALALEFGADEDSAVAALLHDAVEDSTDGAAMVYRIRGQFGHRVATIVAACSDTVAVPGQGKEPWKQRKLQYIAHLKFADADSLLVSACDKLHNARALVRDLKEIGPELWERFTTKNGNDQVWYYQTLLDDVFRSRVRPTLVDALDEAVNELNLEHGGGTKTRRDRTLMPEAVALPVQSAEAVNGTRG